MRARASFSPDPTARRRRDETLTTVQVAAPGPIGQLRAMTEPNSIPTAQADQTALAALILRHAQARGPDKSICPSEVARDFARDDGPDAWRRHLGAVRRAAAALATAGRIDILRKGKPVPPEAARGVIRLRIRPPEPSPETP